jgi:hypothetical protein
LHNFKREAKPKRQQQKNPNYNYKSIMFASNNLRCFLVTFLILLVGAAASSRPARMDPSTRIKDDTAAHPSIEFFLGRREATRKQSHLPGWLKEVKAVNHERCTKEDIIHACVVNCSWGLVGAF